MFSIKKFIIIFFLLIPISNSFGAMVTLKQKVQVQGDGGSIVAGVEFNKDGTKMFTIYANKTLSVHNVNEYNLTVPFDISSRAFAENSERCLLTGTDGNPIYDLEFSSNGMHLFTASRDAGTKSYAADKDKVYRFDLTSPYDVSTCLLASQTSDLDAIINTHGSNAGNYTYTYSEGGAIKNYHDNRVQGLSISPDGSKLFLVWMDATATDTTRLIEYTLSTPYDLTTLSIVTTAGINMGQGTTADVNNPASMRFSSNGKRIFIISHDGGEQGISQISLTNPYDTSSFTMDGKFSFISNSQPRGIAFSKSGFKLYVGNDADSVADEVMEYDLACPFNLFLGKCSAITIGDRTGIAIAQIEVATRTIEQSTDTALNRLKWIRRNKDNQNLTNLNLDLNFTNPMLVSLAKVVKNSATSKKTKDQNQEQKQEQDIFFWSEGSIAVGRVGETKVSSFKKFKTDAITVGADKFTKNNGITGLAFRFGKDDVEVGSAGSNLDTDTYNLTHYTSSPIKDDTKFIDTVIGVGALNFDILSVLDGQRVTAKRDGKQIYGTIKLKDEIKKNNLILVPSAQIDLGYTLLNDYQESGNTAMKFKKQGIQSRNARLSIAAIDELENDKYTIRKHGKLEYKANLHRSSNIKYSYVSDATSGEFDTKLNSGALHNLNGELGIDIILPDSFSIFLIYERNQALGPGHTDKIHLAIGYLPNRKTNYAYKLAGSENIGSEFKISKNINDFEIDFKLNNQDALRPNTIDEATINLTSKF